MIKKIMAVDLQMAERRAREKGFNHFPLLEIREKIASAEGVDLVESLVTVTRRVPENDSPEALATVTQQFENKRFAIEMSGGLVIECPAKPSSASPTGFKQSDDQRLMITTLSLCLRVRPDFLTLVAADGDFAPMVTELRREGIRTEIVAPPEILASDLKRVAVNVIDLDDVLEAVR